MAEQEFSLQDQLEQEFNAYPEEKFKPTNVAILEMAAAMNAARLGAPKKFVEVQMRNLGTTSFHDVDERNRGFQLVQQDFQRNVDQAIEVSDIPAIKEADKKREESEKFVNETSSPEMYTLARDQGGESFDHEMSKVAARYATMQKIIAEYKNKEEVGVASILGDIADILVTAPIDALRLGGFTRTDLAQKARALLTSDISEDEYEREIRGILEQANDAGILQDTNYLFLLSQAQNLEELGEGIEGTLEQAATTADLISLGGLAGVKALRGLSVARSTTGLVSGASSPRVAGRQLREAASEAGSTDPGLARELTPTAARLPESGKTEFSWSAPGGHVAEEVSRQNTFVDILRNLRYSRRIDPKLLDEWTPTGLRQLSENIDQTQQHRVLNLSVDVDDQDNLFGTVSYGRSDGLPFGHGRATPRVARSSAEKFAKQIGGKVRKIDRGGREYFVVDVTRNFPTEGLQRPLNFTEIGQNFLRNFGGTFLTIPRRLDALAKRGEGVFSTGVRRVNTKYKAASKRVSQPEKDNIEAIFYDMRDGRLSHMHRPLNLAEFRSEWAKYSDTPPSAAAEELYLTTQELNDALYWMKADEIFKRVVNDGFEDVLTFDIAKADGTVAKFNLVSKRVDHDNVDDMVYNPITGTEHAPDNIPDNLKVFQVQGGHKIGQRHAKYVGMEEPTLRRLHHSDVLGYNPGGPRQYDFINHMVKQNSQVELLSGRTVAGRPRTILGTATRQEAEFAAEELNNIFREARSRIGNLDKLSPGQAISAIESLGAEFDEVVLLNNTFNTNLETTDDLVKFLQEGGIDPRADVGVAKMDGPLAIADEDNVLRFPFTPDTPNRDLFDMNINNPRNSRRREKPLIGFGGTQAETRSPMDTIQNDFLRVMHSRAYGAYNFQAVGGWVKGAEPYIENPDFIAGKSPMQKLRDAKVNLDSKEGRSYEAARKAILRTLGEQSQFEKMLENKLDLVAEWVWDKGFKVTDPETGAVRPGRTIRALQASRKPFEFLRGMSFDARLGMFAFDQLIVQSSQSANILAIMGPRRIPEFLQATSTHLPVRLAVQTANRHGFDGAIDNIREIGRRTSSFTGMSTDEFVDFARWVYDSGRLEVGGEIAEISAVSPEMARGIFSKFRQGARFFFNEGEKFPRSAGMRVAWNEYKKQFPKSDPFSDHGINWITARQDALTAAMTRASAAAWQRGPLSIPFQFLSYITRMMESLFTDRILSGTISPIRREGGKLKLQMPKGERAKLLVAQGLFWGAAGTGFGSVLDAYIAEGKLEMDDDAYTLARYGLLDAMTQAAFGGEAVIGGRLAPAEGISQLLENWNDGNFGEIVGGPAYSLLQDTGLVLWQGMTDALAGNFSMTESDAVKLMRHISSANRAYQSWFIWHMGNYYSRSGDLVVEGLTKPDAILNAAGFGNERVNFLYKMFDVRKSQTDEIQEHTNRLRTILREHNQAVRDRDLEKAKELQKLISGYIKITPVWAQDRIKRGLAGEVGTMYEQMLGVMQERGYNIINEKIKLEQLRQGQEAEEQ